MVQIKPGGGSEAVQTIKLGEAAPAAPYVIKGTVALAPRADPRFGVRKVTGSPDDWFATDQRLLGKADGIDYWELACRVDSGTATSFAIDDLTEPIGLFGAQQLDQHGQPYTPQQDAQVNQDALAVLGTFNGLHLAVFDRLSSRTFFLPLTGIFDFENPMWQSELKRNGYFRKHRCLQTYYAFLPVQPGGAYGYFHIFATIQADTPEILYELNWTNGGIEERRQPQQPASDQGIDVPAINIGTDDQVPVLALGTFRGQDVLFTRCNVLISPNLPAADGFSGAWVFTSKYASGVGAAATGGDPAARHSTNALVKQVSDADPNKLHAIPITFERPFRFYIAPSSVTPGLKLRTAVQDWSAALGGWAFQKRVGLPLSSAVPAIDLAAVATACKAAFAAATPWRVEPDNSGMQPVSPLWPGSYDAYGGTTGGTGMWAHYGAKFAITGQKAGLEILEIESMRGRCRSYGALYNNITGFPVIPGTHAPGRNAPWRRFDRRFEKQGGTVQDLPFGVTRGGPRRMHLAAYNPGPTGGFVPIDTFGDQTPNVPDWYVAALAGDVLQGSTVPYAITPLAHILPPAGTPDQTVPVLIQIQGAGAYNSAKSVTFEITGTGDTGQAIVESVTITGPASSPPSVQAKQSVGLFRTVTQIRVTAISGTLLATEVFNIGRQGQTLADYNGFDGITSIDCQHWIRHLSINRALALLAGDPLATLYCIMDGMDAQMTFWDGGGNAHRLDSFNNGAPGRGSGFARELGWACDGVATAAALTNGLVSLGTSRRVFKDWITAALVHYQNCFIPQCKLFQMTPGGKEFKTVPLGTLSDERVGLSVFWGCSSREQAYHVHGAYSLSCVAWSELNALKTDVQDKCRQNAKGFKDLLWHMAHTTKIGPHIYCPMALHFDRNGVLRPSHLGLDPLGTFTIFATQADMPTTNPVSGVVLRGDTYPAIDDDRFVAAVTADTIVENTPLTIANASSSTGQPAPVEIKVADGAAPSAAVRSGIFDITGTNPQDQVVTSAVFCQWNAGQAAKLFRIYFGPNGVEGGQHFKTVTDIRLRTGSKTGDWLSSCSIRMGVGPVGMQFDWGGLYNESNATMPGASENYHIPYALAIMKELAEAAGDSADIDTCILRFAGDGTNPAASLAAAKTTILGYGEYTGGPIRRMEQTLTLAHSLRSD